MRPAILFVMLALSLTTAAQAAPLSVRVVDAAGKGVANAVVTVRPLGSARRSPPAGRNYTVLQKNLKFQPFVTVVPVGASVSFPNLDPTKHHVYSFSAPKPFELKLFAREQSRSVRFDKAGVIALGCNIHDNMSAFIVVTDSMWTAVSDARGFVRFTDLPTAASSLTVWHPYLRAPGNQLMRPLAAGDTSELVPIRLRPPPMHDMGGY
jgi:plastocyanin